MLNKNRKKLFGSAAGFTIIEVMIAMAVFTVLVTVGMGAVLDAINQHKQSENLRTAMDNLNFVMEDMARNIRIGSNMHCGGDPILSGTGAVIPLDCTDHASASNKLVFNDYTGTHVIGYIISPPYSSTPNQILKYVDNPANYQIVSPPEIVINYAASGFTVRGAKAFSTGDQGQPSVVIRLTGYVMYKNVKSNFAIETSVTLRALDS